MTDAKRLTPEEFKEMVEKVKALRTVFKTTGVHTAHRIGALIANLHQDDMIELGKLLTLKPRDMPRTGPRQQPIYQRNQPLGK